MFFMLSYFHPNEGLSSTKKIRFIKSKLNNFFITRSNEEAGLRGELHRSKVNVFIAAIKRCKPWSDFRPSNYQLQN